MNLDKSNQRIEHESTWGNIFSLNVKLHVIIWLVAASINGSSRLDENLLSPKFQISYMPNQWVSLFHFSFMWGTALMSVWQEKEIFL